MREHVQHDPAARLRAVVVVADVLAQHAVVVALAADRQNLDGLAFLEQPVGMIARQTREVEARLVQAGEEDLGKQLLFVRNSLMASEPSSSASSVESSDSAAARRSASGRSVVRASSRKPRRVVVLMAVPSPR